MTFGGLAEAVDSARRSADARTPDSALTTGISQRDLDHYMAQQIDWTTSGSLGSEGVAIPAVFASVRLIASTIDQLPITAPVPVRWLRRPQEQGGSFDLGDLVQMTVAAMAVRGHAYLIAELLTSDFGDPRWRLDFADPDTISAHRVVDSYGRVGVEFRARGELVRKLPYLSQRGDRFSWSMGGKYLIHIPYLVTPAHPEGIGPLQAARRALDGYEKAEMQAANLLDSGTWSGGILETEADITADTAARWQEAFVNARKLGRIPVLGTGLRYSNQIISPKDAAWLESRQFNAQQVAQMYGIPPDYLGMTSSGGSSSLSYANSQDNDRRFRKNCLEAFTSQISDALTPLLGYGDGRIDFDYTAWEGGGGDAAANA
jgi:HK97 family phage portal protein